MLAANPKHKIPKENQTGPVPWTEYRARKELPMPSRDLSNFSPAGRTGYTKQLREKSRAGRWICCRFAWKTRCSSKPCAPQSLENAQHSRVFISTYQLKRLNANLLFCLLTATFRPAASQLMPSSNRFFKAKGLPAINSPLPQSFSFLPASVNTTAKLHQAIVRQKDKKATLPALGISEPARKELILQSCQLQLPRRFYGAARNTKLLES